MKFNFEKNVTRPIKKILIGGKIISSVFHPLESPAQTNAGSMRDMSFAIDIAKKDEVATKTIQQESSDEKKNTD